VETDDIPASVSQRLLWMIQHYRSDFGALCCPVVCRVRGPLDRAALQSAVDALVGRHEALRTTFSGRGARLVQHVHPPRPLPVRWQDLSGTADPAAAAAAALAAELADPIDPRQWPARASAWRTGPDEHLFCLNLHHLVTDAWSTAILLRELCGLYDLAFGAAPPAPPGWQYREFVRWQQSLLAGEAVRRHREYWQRQLRGAALPRLAGPARPGAPGRDGPEPATDPAAGSATDGGADPGGVYAVDLDPAVVARLRELARTGQSTLFTVLLAVFHAQLWRVTGQPDIAVASMFLNRSRPELRDTVGLLAGMVLLRSQVGTRASFADLVRHTHAAVVGAFAYQDLPFQLLPGDLVQAHGGRADDVMFNVMTEVRHVRTAGGTRFELEVPTAIGSRFPFELAIAPVGARDLRCVLFRAGGWLDDARAGEFLAGYAELAGRLSADPQAALRPR